MDKKPTTFGLGTNALAKIINVCSEDQSKDEKIPDSQIKEELLQDCLSETLLSGSLKDTPLRKELMHVCCMAGLASGETIRNLLVNPKTEMELIQKIKEHGKRMSSCALPGADHEVANVIYYAAIASALIFHGEKMTQHPLEGLKESFSIFVDTEWISSDLKELFEKATEYCRK